MRAGSAPAAANAARAALMLDEDVTLRSFDESASLVVVTIFHFDGESALQPVNNFAIYRAEQSAVISARPQVKFWPSAFEETFRVYVESALTRILGIEIHQEIAL